MVLLLPRACPMLIHITEFSVGWKCPRSSGEKCYRGKWYSDPFFPSSCKCATIAPSPRTFLLSFQLRWLLYSAFFLRESWGLNQSIYVPTLSPRPGKSLRPLISPEIWRSGGALSRWWAGIHHIPHKFQYRTFKVQSLTYGLGELGMLVLLLSSIAMLLLPILYKGVLFFVLK